MKKFVILLLSFILFISLNNNIHNVTADEPNPYTIYGTVIDENGMVVTGAMITVNNLNTKEENNDGNDTITGKPIVVTTDSQGSYSFELINLRSGFSDGDEIVVTAEKDGIIGSESVIVEKGDWGKRVDISQEIEESQDKELSNVPLKDNWIFFIIIILVVITLIMTISTRRKVKKISSIQMVSERKLPPPPSGYKSGKINFVPKDDKGFQVPELEIPEEDLPPPEDEEEYKCSGLSRIGIFIILIMEIIGIIIALFIKQNIEIL